jgi:hypothetical protein
MRFHHLNKAVWMAVMVSSSAAASERAVESIHYQASAEGRLTEDDAALNDDKNRILGINGEVTLPLGHYFGATFGAAYSDSSRTSYPEADIKGDTLFGYAGVFARDPSLGRVGLTYDRSRFDYTVTGKYPYYAGQQYSDEFDVWAVTLMGEMYSEQVTFGFTQTRAETTNSDDIDNITTVYARWYLTENIVTDVRASIESGEDEVYVLDLEYQPEFLQSSTSFTLGYLHGADLKGVRLAVTYFFDKRFDLKTRDRHYR